MEFDGRYWSMMICKGLKGEAVCGKCDTDVDECRPSQRIR